MNLPLVVDIAIALIFIYLIFSLLTSEIQELITTLLQWRAVHLKESIEGLFAGKNDTTELQRARKLANRLYTNPVINTLNQEAKGFFASIPRRFNQILGKYLLIIFKRENVFGDRNSGPSYIASESFANSFLDTLGIPVVIQKFTLLRMQDFKSNLIAQIAAELQDASIHGVYETTLKIDLVNKEDETQLQELLKQNFGVDDPSQGLTVLKQFYNFRKNLENTIKAYQSGGLDLVATVNRLEEILTQYINEIKVKFPEPSEPQYELIKNLKSLSYKIFGKSPSSHLENQPSSYLSTEKKLLIRYLQPNLTEAVEIVQGFWQLKRYWAIYKEVHQGAILEAIEQLKTIISHQPSLPESIKQRLLKKIQLITTNGSDYGYTRIIHAIETHPNLPLPVKRRLLEKINSLIQSSYDDIREVFEGSQGLGLPESVRNILIEKLEQAKASTISFSILSYELAKIKRRIANQTQTLDGIDEIIEAVNEIIYNSYEKIEEEIKKEPGLNLSIRENLIDLINVITSNRLDFEYATLRKAIENQPGIPLWTKQSFLDEVDKTINGCLENEYEKFHRAIESQPNLNLSVKQSLLLLAAAVTLRKDSEFAALVDQLLGIGSLPESVEQNLLLLAQQAQIKVDGIKEELNQFRREVENWFDRSMERSSGVYKRNAKMVALLLGSLVAVAVNADTMHIITRLSEDQVLRSTVIRAANQIAVDQSELTAFCLSQTERERRQNPQCSQVLNSLDQAARNISLPIGWNEANRNQQWQEARRLGNLRFFRYLLGWLVSGIALSMGASFWYELLGKFINVRNTGQAPPPPREQPNIPPYPRER